MDEALFRLMHFARKGLRKAVPCKRIGMAVGT
jgi:hypothetical protein